MRIGVDLSPLQGPHRMRGIGAVALNVVNAIPDKDKKDQHFIFYLYDDSDALKTSKDPLDLLELAGLDYEVKRLPKAHHIAHNPFHRFAHITRLLRGSKTLLKLAAYHMGDKRVGRSDKLDVFLQFDQEQSMPRGRGFKKVLVIYDIIPYVLESDYLFSYPTARRKGHSRKGALRKAYHRWLYLYKLRANCGRADHLLAISDKTKQDFVQIVGVKAKKISVTPLGISPAHPAKTKDESLAYRNYVKTSWGYMPRPYKLTAPFLLFVGGVDRRRKLDDLVAAFNHLRGEGVSIKLLLAGDILEGPGNIPVPETRRALESSSYADDIVFMGFVPDKVREALYEQALAFVYPSIYEGFGLPVLEAMSNGCPVICYENDAVKESAGGFALYAKDPQGIADHVRRLLDVKQGESSKTKAVTFANQHTWEKTARAMLKELER